jgi:hypothetical protein
MFRAENLPIYFVTSGNAYTLSESADYRLQYITSPFYNF